MLMITSAHEASAHGALEPFSAREVESAADGACPVIRRPVIIRVGLDLHRLERDRPARQALPHAHACDHPFVLLRWSVIARYWAAC